MNIQAELLLAFVVQIVATLTPVAIAMAKQNNRIATLEQANKDLVVENGRLREQIIALDEENDRLQSQLNGLLIQLANLRDGF